VTISPQVIALHGVAGAGKDTVASILADYGYERLALADPIREALLMLDPLIGTKLRLSQAVASFGWDSAKRAYPEVRELMQKFGTEVGRNIFGSTIWLDLVIKKITENPNTKYVITDVRFENERAAFEQWGDDALLVKVERPGFDAVNGHISDSGLEHTLFDASLSNHGSIEDLRDNVDWMMAGNYQPSLVSA
jgi:hypothetical protein